MIVPDYFAGRKDVQVDVRARKLDVGVPRVVRLYACPSFAEALRYVGLASEYPVAIVKEDGTALITSAGGSGHIWVCGDHVNRNQQRIVDELRGVMVSLGAAVDVSDGLADLV